MTPIMRLDLIKSRDRYSFLPLIQRTWLCMQWGAHGQLNSQNRIGIPMADAIASSIKGANIIGRRDSPNKVGRWRRSTGLGRCRLDRRLLLGIRSILLLLRERRRSKLRRRLLLLLLLQLMLLYLLRRWRRMYLLLLVVARVGSRCWTHGQVELLRLRMLVLRRLAPGRRGIMARRGLLDLGRRRMLGRRSIARRLSRRSLRRRVELCLVRGR